MKFYIIPLLLLTLIYLATGVFVVRGNEQAVVRYFGRVRPQLVTSGLHFGLPWPMCQVDRINLNETRTVTVGLGVADEVDDSDFLKPLASSRQSEYLTGDKNILHLQISINYRIDDPFRYLLQQESPERHLRYLTQSLVSDVVARSGVDYVHPLGLNALRERLTVDARRAAGLAGLGVYVEDVNLGDVRPPVPVKQSFLDVSNARAEKERLINEAQTASEKLLAHTAAQASQLRDEAESARAVASSEARSDASRFQSTMDQLAAGDAQERPAMRAMAIERLYWNSLETILPRLARQVFVDGDKPIDFTIQKRRETLPEPAPNPAR